MINEESFDNEHNKLASYDKETRNLMLTAMDFSDAYTEIFSLPEMVYLLRNSFKERLTHAAVLGEKEMRTNTDPSSGFCMIASYLIYSTTGGSKVWELRGTNLHWWLYHKQTHTIFDITHTQFPREDVEKIYKMGVAVKKLKTDMSFHTVLKAKAHTLAHRAGLE